MMPSRIEISKSIDQIVDREDGVTFQRLFRRLYRSQHHLVYPTHHKSDLGVDSRILAISGEAVLCVALTISKTKMRSDIEKCLSNRPNIKRFVFGTASKISNTKISKYVDELSADFNCKIEVLERTWVIDEALRAENTKIVFDELGLVTRTPDNQTEILIGEIVTPSFQERGMYWLEAAYIDGTVLLSEFKLGSIESECITFLLLTTDGPGDSYTVNAADVDVLQTLDSVFASYTKRTGESTHTLTAIEVLSKSRKTMDVSRIEIKKLTSRPLLFRKDNNLFVVYRSEKIPFTQEVVFHALLGEEMHSIPYFDVREIKVCNDNVQAIAVLIAEGAMRVIEYGRDGPKEKLVLDLEGRKANRVARYNIALHNGRLAIAIEFVDGITLQTLIVDTIGYSQSKLNAIAPGGKFPSIAFYADRPVLAWIAGPPLPLEDQERANQAPEVFQSIAVAKNMDVIGEIAKSTKKTIREIMIQEGYSERDIIEREMESIEGADAWSPLWLGLLSTDGRCIRSYGQLGYGSRENNLTKVFINGSKGALIWRSGNFEEEQCLSHVRFLSFI